MVQLCSGTNIMVLRWGRGSLVVSQQKFPMQDKFVERA